MSVKNFVKKKLGFGVDFERNVEFMSGIAKSLYREIFSKEISL